MDVAACIDRVATHYAALPAPGEIERARKQFDASRGRIFDDDEELYKTHMALFLEWFVLERPLDGGEPPAIRALRDEVLPPQEQLLLRSLASSMRSVFVVRRVLSGGLLLQDLILGGRWQVDLEHAMEGLGPGDIFEARLVPGQGRVHFGPVFCFHPRAAGACILALVEQARQEGSLGPELVFDLAEMRLRYSRFRNIAVDRIYQRRTGRQERP